MVPTVPTPKTPASLSTRKVKVCNLVGPFVCCVPVGALFEDAKLWGMP